MMRRRFLAGTLAASTAAAGLATLISRDVHTEKQTKKPDSAVIVGGGVIGLSTAIQLLERGIKVTLLESNNDVAQMASYRNGAIICPSMANSWASIPLLAKNRGELKKIRLSWSSLTDIDFYRWSAWFWTNGIIPGRAEHNHESQRLLAALSLQCLDKEEAKHGSKLAMNRTAVATIKLYHDEEDLRLFLTSDQAKFWEARGYPFEVLTVDEVCKLEPSLAHPTQKRDDGVEIDNRDLVGGLLSKQDTSGDIFVYCKNAENFCKEKGAVIIKNTKAKRLIMEDKKITGVEIDSGEVVKGDVYILAAGLGSRALAKQAGVNLPIYPMKGHMSTLKASILEGEEKVNPPVYNIYSPKHGLMSPLSPDLLRFAGTVEAVGYNFEVEEKKGKLQADLMVGAFKPNYLDWSEVSYHSCLRPVAGDDVPIIGQTQINNLFINSGHGSKGWTHSWGSACLVAQIICGEEPSIDPARYTPKRFHPVQAWLGSLGLTAF